MKTMEKEMFDQQNAFGLGQANTAYAQYFVGNSYLNPLTVPGQCQALARCQKGQLVLSYCCGGSR